MQLPLNWWDPKAHCPYSQLKQTFLGGGPQGSFPHPQSLKGYQKQGKKEGKEKGNKGEERKKIEGKQHDEKGAIQVQAKSPAKKTQG